MQLAEVIGTVVASIGQLAPCLIQDRSIAIWATLRGGEFSGIRSLSSELVIRRTNSLSPGFPGTTRLLRRK